MNRLKLALFASICCTLFACTNTMLYNQLDWLVAWYVDDYVDFNRQQKQSFKTQVQPLLHWHRTEELQSYVLILDSIDAELQQPLTAETVDAWVEALLQAYDRLQQRVLPLAFSTGEQLSDKQMQYFLSRLQEQQEELEEEYLPRTADEYLEESYKRLEENLSDFLGRLQPEQKLQLHFYASQMRRFDKAWLQDRARWLQRLSTLLERNPGWQDAVLTALEQHESERNQAYGDDYDHNQRLIYAAVAAVLNQRSDKQDKRLREEIADIREDLTRLISQDS